MFLRDKVWIDLFQLLSFGRKPIRKRIANIIFHYYPSLLLSDISLDRSRRDEIAFKYYPWIRIFVKSCIKIFDKICHFLKFQNFITVISTPCENLTCSSHGEAASRICLNGQATVAATFGQSSVPLYICEVCYQDGLNEWSPVIDQHKPLQQVTLDCEGRQCNQEQVASYTILSNTIMSRCDATGGKWNWQSPKPTRYCRPCFLEYCQGEL